MKVVLLACFFTCVVGYRLGVLDDTLDGPAPGSTPGGNQGYWFFGPNLVDFRNSVYNTTLFGKDSEVSRYAIETVNISMDTLSLIITDDIIDGIFVAIWEDKLCEPHMQVFHDFFFLGGDVLMFNDRGDFDCIGDVLDVPTTAINVNSGDYFVNVEDYDIISDGPFGTVNTISGWLSGSLIDPLNGTTILTNASGASCGAIWERGEYAPNAGRLGVFSDVNYIANRPIDSPITPANMLFTHNLLAWLSRPPIFPIDCSIQILGCKIDLIGITTLPGLVLYDFDTVVVASSTRIAMEEGRCLRIGKNVTLIIRPDDESTDFPLFVSDCIVGKIRTTVVEEECKEGSTETRSNSLDVLITESEDSECNGDSDSSMVLYISIPAAVCCVLFLTLFITLVLLAIVTARKKYHERRSDESLHGIPGEVNL